MGQISVSFADRTIKEMERLCEMGEYVNRGDLIRKAVSTELKDARKREQNRREEEYDEELGISEF